MRAAWIMVGALLVGACGDGGKDPAVCRREAAELSQLLSTMDHEVAVFLMPGMTLVTRTDLPPTSFAYGRTVMIRPGGATVDGRPLDESLTFDPGDLVHVAIDEAASWEEVARTLVRLEELGVTRPALVFGKTPAPVTKPPRSTIDDDLDALMASEEAGNKATELARMMEKVVKGCAPLQEAFGAVAGVEGESKADTLIRSIEPSLVRCNCNLDVPAFRSIMFRVLYVEKPTSSFRITLDRGGAAIALSATTPWREAHARFSPEARVAITAP